ncbi:MAG: putative hydrolase [Actinomycetia bacterium]|nr:putative hydrolase [Actinomycetes bacterium]
MILLVRHAQAGDQHRWSRADHLRPLSPQGWQEAAGLLARLGGFAVTGVIASPTTRCVQTVDELAARRRIGISVDARLGRYAGLAHLRELLSELDDDEATLLCTHGEVIGPLLTAARSGGAPIPPDAGWPTASTWLLDTAAGRITGADYLPPLRSHERAAAVH